MMEAALGRTLGRSENLVQPDFPSLAAELARLRTAAPTVAVTDVEKAAKKINDRIHEEVGDWFKKIGFKGGGEMGYWIGTVPITDILRDCTSAASVEEVARAIHEDALNGDTWERIVTGNPTALDLRRACARAALRAIGARLAENTGTGAPVSTQHHKDAHGYDKRGHIRGPDERQASDGSGAGGEGRVPRADAAGDLGGEGMQAPGCEPGEAARGPQGDGSRPALDCHRADALPGGPDGCGSRGDATGVLLTRVAALESALRLETDLRVHGDAVIGARLNLLIKAAPDVGAGLAEPEQGMTSEEAARVFSPERVAKAREALAAGDYEVIGAQPVEPEPEPEPTLRIAGVRVKMPKGYTIKTRGTGRDADQIAEQVDAVWIKSLREQGVEVDDE